MAETWLCEMPSEAGLAKRVVVKRLHAHLRDDAELVQMFLDEARITLPLQHSNIATAIELSRDGDDYLIVTEHVEGVDLQVALARLGEAAPPELVLAVATGVLEALAYAHEASDERGRPLHIVHRDVSPGNILLSRRGEVKLADFGVARAAHRMRRTMDGVVRGTLPHMSPEQAAGEEVDARSDLYSLGTVIWRMASGAEIPGLTRGYGEPPLRRLDLREAFDRLLSGSLCASPHERFATARQMQQQVRHALAELVPASDLREAVASFVARVAEPETAPGPARPRTAPTVSLRSAPRRRVAVAIAVVALGGLAALGMRPQWRSSKPAPSPATAAALRVPPPPAPSAAPPAASPAPPPVASSTAPEQSAPGQLDLISTPWAYVELNGRRLPGHTPQHGVTVPAGSHRLRFINPDLGRVREVRVTVRPAAVQRVAVDLEAP